MTGRFLQTLLFAVSAVVFFGLGTLLTARQATANDHEQIAALRAELAHLASRRTQGASGTSGRVDATAAMATDESSRAGLIAEIKGQLKREMGLLPPSLLRERRRSFVEMYSSDSVGGSSYGTAATWATGTSSQ